MKKSLKICMVGHECGYYKGQGGIATYIELTAKGYSRAGYEVHVVYLNGSELDDPNITSWKVEDKHSIYKNSISIDAVLEKIKPDIVESTDFLGLVSYTLAKRVRYGLSYDCKFVNNNHTGIREVWEWGTGLDFLECCPNWMAEVYQYERAQALLSDANLSTSNFLTNYLSSQYNTPYVFCPSYYELKNIEKDSDQHFKSNSLRILSLGRFELRKKQELLVKACCEMLVDGHDVHVTLIGNSGGNFYNRKDYMESCYSLIPLEFKKHFSFFDFIPYKELQNRYTTYDLFVIPSPYENFPNTALEAINYGLVVAGSKTSGIADMIGETSEVLCFDKNSVSSMREVLTNYMNMDNAKRLEVRDMQKRSLQSLASYENAIIKRISLYSSFDSKKAHKKILREQCIFVTLSASGALLAVYFRGEKHYSQNQYNTQLFSMADFLIILPNNNYNNFDLESNYFPEKNVISAFSSDVPYGTIEDLTRGRKSFSQLTINICDNKYEHEHELDIAKIIAKTLKDCQDIIFFKDSSSHSEMGIGEEIMYEIDLLRHKFNG
jgi:glycosyltransferase involved in cell wall biosynthesis